MGATTFPRERGHVARRVRHFAGQLCRLDLRYSQVSRLFCDLQKSRRQHAGGSEQNARAPLSYCERNFC
jgi:hypothetical protein